MEGNKWTIPKMCLGLFVFALLCGFGKSMAYSGILHARDEQLTRMTQVLSSLQHVDQQVAEAKTQHPKYTDTLSVTEAIKRVTSEHDYLVALPTTEDPRPIERATARAKQVVATTALIQKEVATFIAKLDTALAHYTQAEPRMRTDALEVKTRVAELVQQGYYTRHFSDAEAVIAQINSQADALAVLSKKIDPRDARPDYVLIYEKGEAARALRTQAFSLANRIPELRATVQSVSQEAARSLWSARSALPQAYSAARRVESYRAYRSKDFTGGLREWESTFSVLDQNLTEVRRRNGMDVQDFYGAQDLLENVRSQLQKLHAYIARVEDFDDAVQRAVSSLPSARSRASSAIGDADSHIREWSQNDQSEAEELVRTARSYYSTGRLNESDDPLSALRSYRSAASYASQAYDAVDTYVPPPPTIDSDDDDSGSSFGGGSSSSGFGGSSSSGLGGGGSSSPGSGSYGGPGAGSRGDGG